MKRIQHFTLILLAFLATSQLFGQGATTSSLYGFVVDPSGEPLIGANVTAIHTPTGSFYGTSTDVDGSYRIPNMQVGGPYDVTVSYTGFGDKVVRGLYLKLGERQKRDFNLEESAIELVGAEVVAQKGASGQNAGAVTQITREAIEVLPTINRDINDYTRLTPQASTTAGNGGVSFAGINNRYNATYIDGAISNDVFGLADNGANGGQTGIQPISADWIEDIQVMLSPYDVTLGGFAGGGINMVTKSGTNEFHGSAYYFTRNENLAGKTNKEQSDFNSSDRTKLDEFSEKTYGFTLGGPIIKNKLFFFAGVELIDNETPAPFDLAAYRGNATAADLDNLRSTLQSRYGYDAGGYLDKTDKLEGTSVFGKINWNINEKHKLIFRHSYVDAENNNLSASNGSNINFASNGQFFPSTTHSTTLQLNSLFSSRSSNNLTLVYTTVEDDRDPVGQDFPDVDIQDGNGRIHFGSEPFSTANGLDQTQFSITDNFKLFRGAHTITIGTHNEFYDIRNVFIARNYGTYGYDNLDQFLNEEAPSSFSRTYSLPVDIVGDATTAAGEFNAMQLGFYVQDEWQVNRQFSLTAGLRADIPVITSDPVHHSSVQETLDMVSQQYPIANEVSPGSAPSGQFLLSPKVGFSYDFEGDGQTVLRGGLGIFTSRVPFVWPGAMFSNNGINLGQTRATPDRFEPDVNNQPVADNFSVPSGQLDLFVDDFKYPQVFRTSLALDKQFGNGLSGYVEGIYTKYLNNVEYTNVNNDRTGVTSLGGDAGGERVRYQRQSIDSDYTAIYVGSNTSEGFTYNLTAGIQKRWDFGLAASLAWNYNDAEAVNEGTSSQNSSQWRGQIHISDRNNPVVGRSDYATAHRLIGTLTYTHKWDGTEKYATRIALVYEGNSGEAFSYVVGNRSGQNLANETGSTGRNRSLVYVPSSLDEINLVATDDFTVEEQWSLLNNFIEDDDHLSDRRGQYAEKNGARAPWNNRWDLAIRQNLGMSIGERIHRLQLTLDIQNFANLISSSWGVTYETPDEQVYSLYNYEGLDDSGNAQYSFTRGTRDLGDGKFDFDNVDSRWLMRVGLRYEF